MLWLDAVLSIELKSNQVSENALHVVQAMEWRISIHPFSAGLARRPFFNRIGKADISSSHRIQRGERNVE
jgi:hypothetical protein